MKLKARMKTATEDEILHIGSGSSFFFIGTKEEYNRDIYPICDKYIKSARATLNQNKRQLETLLKLPVASKDAIKQYESKIKEMEQYIEDFTPFPEREIEEEYPRLLGDGIVLSIEGTESGAYWLRSEYLETSRKKGK